MKELILAMVKIETIPAAAAAEFKYCNQVQLVHMSSATLLD